MRKIRKTAVVIALFAAIASQPIGSSLGHQTSGEGIWPIVRVRSAQQ